MGTNKLGEHSELFQYGIPRSLASGEAYLLNLKENSDLSPSILGKQTVICRIPNQELTLALIKPLKVEIMENIASIVVGRRS